MSSVRSSKHPTLSKKENLNHLPAVRNCSKKLAVVSRSVVLKSKKLKNTGRYFSLDFEQNLGVCRDVVAGALQVLLVVLSHWRTLNSLCLGADKFWLKKNFCRVWLCLFWNEKKMPEQNCERQSESKIPVILLFLFLSCFVLFCPLHNSLDVSRNNFSLKRKIVQNAQKIIRWLLNTFRWMTTFQNPGKTRNGTESGWTLTIYRSRPSLWTETRDDAWLTLTRCLKTRWDTAESLHKVAPGKKPQAKCHPKVGSLRTRTLEVNVVLMIGGDLLFLEIEKFEVSEARCLDKINFWAQTKRPKISIRDERENIFIVDDIKEENANLKAKT